MAMLCLEACLVLWSWSTVLVTVALLQVPLSHLTLPTRVHLGLMVRIRPWGPQATLHMSALEQVNGRAVPGSGWLGLCSGESLGLTEPSRQI